MTNEEFTEELLIKSHSLGIHNQVFELSKELRKTNPQLDLFGSIELAYYKLTE